MYYKSAAGVFPLRSTSPEAMQTLKFTEASDVWSFGITLFEMFTDNGLPYPELNNDEVIMKVQAGVRPTQPPGCPAAMFELMARCWAADSASRSVDLLRPGPAWFCARRTQRSKRVEYQPLCT